MYFQDFLSGAITFLIFISVWNLGSWLVGLYYSRNKVNLIPTTLGEALQWAEDVFRENEEIRQNMNNSVRALFQTEAEYLEFMESHYRWQRIHRLSNMKRRKTKSQRVNWQQEGF